MVYVKSTFYSSGYDDKSSSHNAVLPWSQGKSIQLINLFWSELKNNENNKIEVFVWILSLFFLPPQVLCIFLLFYWVYLLCLGANVCKTNLCQIVIVRGWLWKQRSLVCQGKIKLFPTWERTVLTNWYSRFFGMLLAFI